ncbi:MAG: RagB/SusD family nutrient uptake outer membrane protein [Chitinophagaceae bacterium]|nr:RagB/SusD family nutrient uptake outer membrane protein [Chitinophagaceae bacterium]
MKKHINILLYVFLGIVALNGISCKKDFLNRKSLNAYSESDVWTNINLVQTFVNSKYRALPSIERGRAIPSAVPLSGASSEGYAQFNYESAKKWNLGEVTPDNLSMDVWQPYYDFIRSCNTFFENIDAVEGDPGIKKRLTGEMTFIRAWCYFDLTRRYGGVPLITKVYSLADTDYMVPRNTYEECIRFVADELDKAIADLPLSYTGNDIGRITKGAAMALKSRALLYAASPLNNPTNDQAKWKAASDAAEELINLGVYSLYQGEYGQIFLEKFNPEIILSYNVNNTRNDFFDRFEHRLNVYIGPNGYHGWSAYAPSQHLVDQFEMKNGRMISEPGSGYDPANPYDNRDPRFYADILFNGAPFRGRPYESFVGGYDSPQSSIENWNASVVGYNWRKYADESQPIDENLGSNQSWIIFRLAEIYLNYAEAQYGLGNEVNARKYVNFVRDRPSVEMPEITASGSDLLKAIQHEREIELCFEGHRFFDVRRWKIAMDTEAKPLLGVHIEKAIGGALTYSYPQIQGRKFSEAHYLFPIPTYEMNKNTKLTQNPGY